MNAIEGRAIRPLFAAPGLVPLGAMPLWGIAAPAGTHAPIGLIVLVLVVLGSLGFGAVRLNARRGGRGRAGGGGQQEGASVPSGQPRPVSPADMRAGMRAVPSGRPARAPAPAGGWAVETHDLTKRFGANVAVDDVELLVPRGCAFGDLGPNGAGKTTLIRTLLGLTRADSGTMSLLGVPVPAERSRALARVGAIVDEPRFHHHLTGRDNLRLLAAARGGDPGQRIGPSLARVGLAERADDKVAALAAARARAGCSSAGAAR